MRPNSRARGQRHTSRPELSNCHVLRILLSSMSHSIRDPPRRPVASGLAGIPSAPKLGQIPTPFCIRAGRKNHARATAKTRVHDCQNTENHNITTANHQKHSKTKRARVPKLENHKTHSCKSPNNHEQSTHARMPNTKMFLCYQLKS